jgi:hypothetical protein
MKQWMQRLALAATAGLLFVAVGCGNDTGSPPPPPPPTVDASEQPTDALSAVPSIIALSRSDPMGCAPNQTSELVLTVTVTNTVGQPTFNWGTLSGCQPVSGTMTNTATFSCPHTVTSGGLVTVSATNGATTRSYTVPICGQPTLR